jgi:hypothetical protein
MIIYQLESIQERHKHDLIAYDFEQDRYVVFDGSTPEHQEEKVLTRYLPVYTQDFHIAGWYQEGTAPPGTIALGDSVQHHSGMYGIVFRMNKGRLWFQTPDSHVISIPLKEAKKIMRIE